MPEINVSRNADIVLQLGAPLLILKNALLVIADCFILLYITVQYLFNVI